MRRMTGLAAAAILAIGIVPFTATAKSGHVYQPVGDTGVAVGLETPSSQGRTCAFVETPTGYTAVGVGAGIYFQSGAGKYDGHNQTESIDDGSICDADSGD